MKRLKIFHQFDRYIEDFNKINAKPEDYQEGDELDTQEIVENPMNAYHILKRTVIDWEVVAEAIKNHTIVGGKAFCKLFSNVLTTTNVLLGSSCSEDSEIDCLSVAKDNYSDLDTLTLSMVEVSYCFSCKCPPMSALSFL